MNWQQALASILDLDLSQCQFTPCHGGDINQSFCLSTSGGDKFFVKHHSQAQPDFFESEAFGLDTLRNKSPLVIPKVITHHAQFLCMEWIDIQSPRENFFEKLGHGLAELHKNSCPSWGFTQHNYIGTVKQFNSPENDFASFFWEQRIEPHVKRCSLLDSEALKKFSQLEHKLPDILDTPREKPALIHGDLWSGNFMCRDDNTPVIMDPSVAYSHREMELAYTTLFGGFSSTFYDAYNEAFPLDEGYSDRKNLYNLYPLLTHTLLFGKSYLGQTLSILESYIK